ncbi:MAG TPA: BrnT family toxin [Rhizomicrobium sp.]|nr:BrnT family toxin [Rhizomicrobium sp.]
MIVEWDEAKRRANLSKHGADFADVPFLDWDTATVLPDSRFDYPERRFWAFGMLRGRLHLVAFCIRGERIRIISFRKANRKEVKRHAKKDEDGG